MVRIYLWERGNISDFPETVAQEIPKRNFQLLASFLQAEESIAASAAPFSERVEALIFRFFTKSRISLSRRLLWNGIFGSLKNQQEFGLVLMDTPEREIEGDEQVFWVKIWSKRASSWLFFSSLGAVWNSFRAW